MRMRLDNSNNVPARERAISKNSTRSKAVFGIIGLSLLAVASCGVTYTSPRVNERDPEIPVNVIPLTAATAAAANQSAYSPRGIPSEFVHIANGGTGVLGLGALPIAPDVPTERPRTIVSNPPPAEDPGAYRIGVGDVVLLATRGNASTIEQLSGLLAAQNQRQGYTVRDDGAIAIPEVGSVPIAGLTLEQAEAQLFQVLVENQIDPSFSLEVAEFNSQKVAVGGAVAAAQLVPITLRPVTLSDAITLAGGIQIRDEEFGVIRIYRDGTLYQVPVEAYLRDASLRDSPLLNGDAIYVDTTYDLDRALQFYEQQIDIIQLRSGARATALQALQAEVGLIRAEMEERRENFQARINLDAIPRDYVYLAGEVTKQSRVPLPFERMASLADVLYDQGGFDNTTGNPSQIYVLRSGVGASRPGEITAYHLDTRNAVNIVTATKMEMRPNDVVFIEEQPITKWSRSLQQLLPALISQVGN